VQYGIPLLRNYEFQHHLLHVANFFEEKFLIDAAGSGM
jgi:hypothetical protein